MEDFVWAMLSFANEAYCSMEVARKATGQMRGEMFEVYDRKVGIIFDYIHLNELQYFNLEENGEYPGWQTINDTGPMHPIMEGW